MPVVSELWETKAEFGGFKATRVHSESKPIWATERDLVWQKQLNKKEQTNLPTWIVLILSLTDGRHFDH